MSFWDTLGQVGLGVATGGVSAIPGAQDYFGKAMGASQFQTDPTRFQLPNFQNTQDYTGFQAQHAIGQQAPQLNGIPQQQFRGQQSMLGNLLMSAAQGRGPSAAQAQLQQATDANIRNAMAMGQSMPGQNNMSAYRSILENQANAQQQAAGQSAVLRAQEQQGAQSALGNLLQGARGQDIGMAGQNAQLTQNQFGMDQNAAQGWYGMGQKADEEQLQGNIEQQKIASGAYNNSQQAAQGVVGGLFKGLGSSLAMAGGGEVPHYAMGGVHHYNEGFTHGVLALLGGGRVPGHASVVGDSEENDTVDAKLSPGEIVLPRSVTQDEDAAEKARLFVEAIRKKNAKGR